MVSRTCSAPPVSKTMPIGRATHIDGQSAQRDDGAAARLHDDAGVVGAGAAGTRIDDSLDPFRHDADRLGDDQRPEIAGSENVDGAVVVGLIMSELKGAARCGSRAIARIAARWLGNICSPNCFR